jgi:lysozyme
MKINRAGLNLIKDFEGLRLIGYRCPAGIPTVGYGHTGPEVRVGRRITEEQANTYLINDVSRFERGVTDAIGTAPTTENQFSAMVSLAYNIGLGAFGKSSVLRHHKAGHRHRAAASFLLWVKAAGKTLPGLVRRRNAERRMFLS